jgi:hypothetical protein
MSLDNAARRTFAAGDVSDEQARVGKQTKGNPQLRQIQSQDLRKQTRPTRDGLLNIAAPCRNSKRTTPSGAADGFLRTPHGARGAPLPETCIGPANDDFHGEISFRSSKAWD